MEARLGLLVDLVEQGVISSAEALLRADTKVLYAAMQDTDEGTMEGKAAAKLLGWSDEYRSLGMRIRVDDPDIIRYIGAAGSEGCVVLEGQMLFQHRCLSELYRMYRDIHGSGELVQPEDDNRRRIAHRMLRLLEAYYELLLESLQGAPLTVSIDVQEHLDGFGTVQDIHWEALLRAALSVVRRGGEPRIEIVVAEPSMPETFRRTREWIDMVAEQTLCGRLRCVAYRVGVILKETECSPQRAAEFASLADVLLVEAESRVAAIGVEVPDNPLKDIIRAVRAMKPQLPVWAITSGNALPLDEFMDCGLDGVVCHVTEAPMIRLAAARWGISHGKTEASHILDQAKGL